MMDWSCTQAKRYTLGLLFTSYPSKNLIICFPFTLSIILCQQLSLFFPNGGHLIWNETHHCHSLQTGLSFLFFPLLFIFSSSSSSLSTQGPGAGLSACQAARIPHVRQGWVSLPLTQSVSQSVGRSSPQSRLCGGKHQRGGSMEKHFPFSHCSQMSILVFHTARHFPALSNRSASRSFQPMQKINDIIAT